MDGEEVGLSIDECEADAIECDKSLGEEIMRPTFWAGEDIDIAFDLLQLSLAIDVS